MVFDSKPLALYVVPVTGVPEVPCPAPDETTSTPKFVAVGCDQFIVALLDVKVVVIPSTGVHAVITRTLSTNHLSPAVDVTPV